MTTFTNWDNAPLILNASHIAQIMGLSKPVVYELMKRADFPTVEVSSKRKVVSKDAFISWLDTQARKSI